MNPATANVVMTPRRTDAERARRADEVIADLTAKLKKANQKIHDQRAQLRSYQVKWETIQFLRRSRGAGGFDMDIAQRLASTPHVLRAMEELKRGDRDRALTFLGQAASLI